MTAIACLALALANVPPSGADSKVVMYFFWGDGCPHCAAEKPFLEALKQKYPSLEVRDYETWHSTDNAKLYSDMCTAYGIKPLGVPATFVGAFEPVVGYDKDSTTGAKIESLVKSCMESGCIDPIERVTGQGACNCSASGEWSLCIGGSQSRAAYNCSAATGYRCELQNEARACTNVGGQVRIDFFYYCNLTMCQQVDALLDQIVARHNTTTLTKHELSDPTEAELLKKYNRAYAPDITILHPAVFIGDHYYTSYEEINRNLEAEIASCEKNGCVNPRDKADAAAGDVIELPFLGPIDTSRISLPAFTVVIAAMDSFNPCAFFVLFFLLGMLIYAESRRRMLLIGAVFVLFSGFVYFLFMSAWLNFFLLAGQIMLLTAAAGAVAVAAALINIKDFFFFKKGVSLTMSESKRSSLFSRMRRIVGETSLPSAVAATMVLAAAANMYELLCTVGFPMVYTRALTLHSLPALNYYLYLVLYNVIYVLPLAGIVLLFTLTVGARKLSEFQGRALKLLSGTMMLMLGVILVISPSLLNNIFAAGGMLLLALLLTACIAWIAKSRERTKGNRAPEHHDAEKHDAPENAGTDDAQKKEGTNGGKASS